LWDGANLSWQTPNFTLSSAGILTLTGSLNATSGNIGGWGIGQNRLYSNHITISSALNEERISIDALYAGFDYPGIYFGYS